jgi:hypothetical protein
VLILLVWVFLWVVVVLVGGQLICCWSFCIGVVEFWVFVGVDFVGLGVSVGCGASGWPD